MRKRLIAALLLAPLIAGCATNEAAHEDEIAELRDQVTALHAQLEGARREAAEAREVAERQHEEAQRMREAHPEIREARRQLKVMRYAVEAWVKADRHDLAEQMERAMHALELRIEGRRDDEAVAIYEAAPDRETQAELLAGASRWLREHERIERAQATADLADVMAGKGRQRTEESEDRLRRIANLAERAMHRTELVEERVREIEERMNGIEEVLLELRNR